MSFSDSGGGTFYDSILPLQDSGGVFITKSYTFTATSNAPNYGSLATSSTGMPVNAYVEFKWIKLEIGNESTDWTPAPEDTDTAISASQAIAESYTDSQVSILQGSINLKVDSTYVQTQIGNIEIGGSNLLLSSGFTLNSYPGWGSYFTNSVVPAYSTVADVFSRSGYALQLMLSSASGTGVGGLYVKPQINHNNFHCIVGSTYTISGYIKLSKASSGLDIGYEDGSPPIRISIPANTWTYFKYTFTTITTDKAIHFYDYSNALITGDTISVCSVQLESGNKATAWAPAPEDIQGQINLTVTQTYVDNQLNKRITAPVTLTNTAVSFATGTGTESTTPIGFLDGSPIQIDIDGNPATSLTWAQFKALNLTWAQFKAKYNSFAQFENGAIVNPVYISTDGTRTSTLSIIAVIQQGDHLKYDGNQAYLNGNAVPTSGSLLAYTVGTITIQGTTVLFTTKLTYSMDTYYDDIQTTMSASTAAVTLLSDQIDLKVDKNGIIAQINISPEVITLKASRIDIDGLVTQLNTKLLVAEKITNSNSSLYGIIGLLPNNKYGLALLDDVTTYGQISPVYREGLNGIQIGIPFANDSNAVGTMYFDAGGCHAEGPLTIGTGNTSGYYNTFTTNASIGNLQINGHDLENSAFFLGPWTLTFQQGMLLDADRSGTVLSGTIPIGNGHSLIFTNGMFTGYV
jgi:hypothetical protein